MEASLEVYSSHAGTIRISGKSSPIGVGRCAAHYLERNNLPIDFLLIGAEANQQATKAMSCFRQIVETELSSIGITVLFQPLRYTVETNNKAEPSSSGIMKDCIVWRTFITKDGKIVPNPKPGEANVIPRR